MKFDFKLDEKELKKMLNPVMQDIAKEYEREFDSLVRTHKGKSVAQIKPALKKIFESRGGKISGKELDEYAQMVSDGVKIKFKA